MKLVKKNQEPLPLKHLKLIWNHSLHSMAVCLRDSTHLTAQQTLQVLGALLLIQWDETSKALGVPSNQPTEISDNIKALLTEEGFGQLATWLNEVPPMNWGTTGTKEN